MILRTRHPAALGPVAIAAGLMMLCAPGAGASTLSPLPPADYTARAFCGPPARAQAACLALALVPQTASARAHTHPLGMARPALAPATSPVAAGYIGLRPQDLHGAYALPDTSAGAQKIAIVDAYNDPSAEADLKGYDEEFGLPACTSGNGCFTQLNQNGKASPLPFPKTSGELESARGGSAGERKTAERATGWDGEISLDIETAHAVCENCSILLVEAETSAYANLEAAEHSAAVLGAGEISNSWGGPEEGETAAAEKASPFNDPGVVITASAGDDGYLGWDAANSAERGFAEFPASSPHVVAVGGTRLQIEAGGAWAGETVWNGDGADGGGCSTIFEAQPWQQNVAGWGQVGCHRERAVSDIAADADPYTGVAVHDTSPECRSEYEREGTLHELADWCTVGGTSLASPLIASVFALAGGAKGAPYPARTLYQNKLAAPAALHDVTSGSNGACASAFQIETGLSNCTLSAEAESCAAKRICLAGSGYDGPSGLGTPDGLLGFTRSAEDEAAGEETLPPEEPEEAPTGPEEEGGSRESEQSLPILGRGRSADSPPAASVYGATPTAPLAIIADTKPSVELSALTLTRAALIALNRSRPKMSQVGFQFTINLTAQVRATLARRIRSHRHNRWSPLHHSLTFTAAGGHDSRRLGGGTVLAAGVYRLTLTPVHGAARSLVFAIG